MKTLLFGPQGVGKTSLMRTTCLGYSFVKVANLAPTKGVSRETFIFRGLLDLNVWDAGGQKKYLEKYFTPSKKVQIFSEVDVAIFMVEATENCNNSETRELFDQFLAAIFEYSPQIKKIYVLINKIDLEDSIEDEVFKTLTDRLDPEILKKCSFTPVSVKKGSAQHRLIEILDTSLQNSIIEMQKLNKIRSLLEVIKEKFHVDVAVFNKVDGLMVSSTMGKFFMEPLRFLSLKVSSLESNIHSVYSKLMTFAKRKASPIEISSILYESEDNYVLLKDLTENSVILIITKDKSKQVIPELLSFFSENDEVIQSLKKELKYRIIY
ncbi:MAG: ADP-ribosylation factor-like protein [Promethearchaeota archaeon]